MCSSDLIAQKHAAKDPKKNQALLARAKPKTDSKNLIPKEEPKLGKNQPHIKPETTPIAQKSAAPTKAPDTKHLDQRELPAQPAKDLREEKLPPIRIKKEDSHKLAESLKNMSMQTATQAPDLPALSQHMISSLKANNSPLVKAADPIVQAASSQAPQKPLVSKERAAPQQTLKQGKQEQAQQLQKQVIKQVKFHLKMLLNDGKNQVQIQLKPHFLGNVKISIEMDHDKQISQLTFNVQNESTKELLQGQLQQLKESLEEKDISLLDVDVKSEQDENSLGKSNSSQELEDLKKAQKWIRSFQTLKLEGQEEGGEIQEASEPEDPNQIINIVV